MFRNTRGTTAGMIGIAVAGLILGSSAFAAQPFAGIDGDKDGRVSRVEFVHVAPTHAAEFAKLDPDNDRYISEAEAINYLQAAAADLDRPVPEGLFATVDGVK
jgi:hypothetical protein